MRPERAVYTLVWLTGTGIEICPGYVWTVSACMGPERLAACMGFERAVYTLVLLTGTGIEICQYGNGWSVCLHGSRTCSCFHGS